MVMMEEAPKKKYKKHTTGGKITIKYYLNKALKSRISHEGEALYPLYIQVRIKRQSAMIKSRINENMLSISEYYEVNNNLLKVENDYYDGSFKRLFSGSAKIISISNAIFDERIIMLSILSDVNPFETDNFKITSFTSTFMLYSTGLKHFASTMFTQTMKRFLYEQTNEISLTYLTTIDWTKDVLNIWSLLSREFVEVGSLKEQFPVLFKLLLPNNTLIGLSDDESYFYETLSQKCNFFSIMTKSFKDDYEPKLSNYYDLINEFRKESNEIIRLRLKPN
jgi:hypothetical protein